VSETLEQTLRRLVIEECLSPEVAAQKALDSVSKAKLAEFVRPLVLLRAKGMERKLVRRVEETAFGDAGGDQPAMTRAEARRRLVAEQFPLPDGRWVPWGQATPDNHRARAGWMRKHAAAVVADAERHEQAAALIEQSGTSCLDDIPGWGDLIGEAA
jgi:hypothetical protein